MVKKDYSLYGIEMPKLDKSVSFDEFRNIINGLQHRVERQKAFRSYFDSRCVGRYRNISGEYFKNIMDSIQKERLYFSSIGQFNDPYDSLAFISRKSFEEQCKKEWEEGIDDYISAVIQNTPFSKDQIYQAIENSSMECFFERIFSLMERTRDLIQSNTKVICFSDNYMSPLMWAHYAGEFTGIEFIFEESELRDSEIFTSNHEKTVVEYCIEKVEYSKERIDLTWELRSYAYWLDSLMYPSIMGPDFIKKPVFKDVRATLLRKSNVWEYEKEKRLIPKNIDLEVESKVQYMHILPKAIIAGPRIDKNHLSLLIDICKNKSIDLFKLSIREDEYVYDYELEEIFVY